MSLLTHSSVHSKWTRLISYGPVAISIDSTHQPHHRWKSHRQCHRHDSPHDTLISNRRHLATKTTTPQPSKPPPSPPSSPKKPAYIPPSNDDLLRAAGKKLAMPARVLVYHAGIGRVVVIAMIKLTTIFHAVVELCSIYPALAAGESILSAAGLAATGLIPLVFVSTTTAPIATAIHLHLPAYARANARLFERFVASVPPSEATVDMTTLSFIGKPRVSRMKLSELRHVPPDKPWRHTVLGLVNWERDTEAEDRRRKWYHYRAIGKFGVHWANKGVRYAWVWKVLKDKVGVKEAERKSEVKKVDKGNYD